jgi:hypothetical protein
MTHYYWEAHIPAYISCSRSWAELTASSTGRYPLRLLEKTKEHFHSSWAWREAARRGEKAAGCGRRRTQWGPRRALRRKAQPGGALSCSSRAGVGVGGATTSVSPTQRRPRMVPATRGVKQRPRRGATAVRVAGGTGEWWCSTVKPLVPYR